MGREGLLGCGFAGAASVLLGASWWEPPVEFTVQLFKLRGGTCDLPMGMEENKQ